MCIGLTTTFRVLGELNSFFIIKINILILIFIYIIPLIFFIPVLLINLTD